MYTTTNPTLKATFKDEGAQRSRSRKESCSWIYISAWAAVIAAEICPPARWVLGFETLTRAVRKPPSSLSVVVIIILQLTCRRLSLLYNMSNGPRSLFTLNSYCYHPLSTHQPFRLFWQGNHTRDNRNGPGSPNKAININEEIVAAI